MISESDSFDFAVVGESVVGVLIALGLRGKGASVLLMNFAESASPDSLIEIPPSRITPVASSGGSFVEYARTQLTAAGVVQMLDVRQGVREILLPAGAAEVAIKIANGDAVRAAKIIYSPNGMESGVPWLPEVAALFGRGVSMCAWSDASFYAGKPVGVVGAGPRAAQQAILAHQAGAVPTIFCPFEHFQPYDLEDHLAGRSIEVLEAVSIEHVIADESGVCELLLERGRGLGFKAPASALFLAQGLVCDWQLFGDAPVLEPIHPRLVKAGLASGLPYWDLRAHIEQAERFVNELVRV